MEDIRLRKVVGKKPVEKKPDNQFTIMYYTTIGNK